MREKWFRFLASPWLIAAVALFLRLLYVFYRVHLIPSHVLATAPFENEVGNIAAALVHGDGFGCVFGQPTGPTAWVAPVYPLLIAAIFKIFGAFSLGAFYAAVLLNCLCSALVCFPLFRAAQRVGGPTVAIPAACLWAFFPSGIILPYAWIWDTSLSAFLASLLLRTTLQLPDSPDLRSYIGYGLLWGLALLTNPSLGALLPFLVAWIFFRDPALSLVKSKRLGLTLAVIFLCCLPWTIRNYVYFHRVIPIRSNFAFEFWSGNNEIFDAHSRAVNRITRYEQAHLYAKLGETAFFDDKWQRAKIFVEANPRLYFRLCAQRIVATWLGTDSPWQDFRETDSFLARFLILWNAITLLGVLTGLLCLFLQRSVYFFPILSFPLFFPIAFYLAHTSLRHRHPCDPVLTLLLAVAFATPHLSKIR
jgi:4-amino-4-deoxy-L-arabinose transferase-like glycosyltransferase